MTTEALHSLFALLDTEEDNFSALVQRFGIDPAKDLQNCDLSDVDFGKLTADILDLTGSNLQGANLSRIRCKKIIGVDTGLLGAIEPEKNVWKDVLLAIYRYQNSDWVTNRVVESFQEGPAPILAFYDTSAEQDVLTKRLCTQFGDASHVRAGYSPHVVGSGTKLLWFYSKAEIGKFRLNPTSLDRNFFELLRDGTASDDVGIYPFRSNQAAVRRIRNRLRGTSYNEMADDFATGLQGYFGADLTEGYSTGYGSVLLLSGYPPISKRFYRVIRDAGLRRLKLIFLCPSSLEPFYKENDGMLWRRVAVPAYSTGEPRVAPEDISRLQRRIGVASNGAITLGKNAEALMKQFIGKPLTELKAQLSHRIKAATRPTATRSIPVSFVL
jgi:hypothetical protein